MNKRKLFLIIFAFLLSKFSYSQEIPKYKNPDLPVEERVEDLISRMTIEEKVSQMVHNSRAVERLEIPAYNWWNEALHGFARNGLATVFPMPIGLAATWDRELIYKVANVISDEARAYYNLKLRNNKNRIYFGLTLWSPNINIFRDPRWGRGMETYGEDPYLTGELAVQYIKGLQGDDERYFKTIATPKHFAVHSGPESERHHFNAIVNEYDLRNTYLPHFKKCIIEGNAQSIMCAYNRLLGEPCCGSNLLLKKILRDEWNFNGFVVSDCWAVSDIFNYHKVTNSLEDAVVLSLIAGTDLECGNSYHLLLKAYQNGIINEKNIDDALRKIFTIRFKLGMFDPPDKISYSKLGKESIDNQNNRELALDAARKSIVLLKNEKNILPLKSTYKKIAIIGPNADNLESLLGNYHGFPSNPVTPLKAFKSRMKNCEILYERGCYFADKVPSFDLVESKYLFTSEDKKHDGLKGEYYNNIFFNGKPEIIRNDSLIDFSWLNNSPVSNQDSFSVRWSGYLIPPVTGEYALGGYGYNGFRIYLDDSLLVKYDGEFDPEIKYKFINLIEGRAYKIKVELYRKEKYSFIKLLWALPEDYAKSKAIKIAKKSDLIILFMGSTPRLEGEALQIETKEFKGGDRITLNLPELQLKFIKEINKIGKPVILVLLNGGPLSIKWEKKFIPAIIEAWYPGQSGGDAVYDVIVGNFNPCGKLPVTVYESEKELPPFSDYNMNGRTYKYYKGKVLYPFGYGLSYSSFKIKNIRLNKNYFNVDDTIKVTFDVINNSNNDGEETIQVYVKFLNGKEIKELKEFKKVFVKANEKVRAEIKLTTKTLEKWNEKNGYNIEKGKYVIMVGTSSSNKNLCKKTFWIK